MGIQAVLPPVDNTVNLSSNRIKSGEGFEKILQWMNEEIDIVEMKKFLDEKFNVNTVVVDYSCEKTDSEAESYDISMLDKYDMHGGRNVVISKKTLLRMKRDGAFSQKVYKSIQDIPWSSKLTGGSVKGNGVFIHEDGTGGYYMEFDWGDEEEEKTKSKSKNPNVLYSDSSEIQNLNISAYDELDHAGFKTDVLLSLVGAKMRHAGKYVGETSELEDKYCSLCGSMIKADGSCPLCGIPTFISGNGRSGNQKIAQAASSQAL